MASARYVRNLVAGLASLVLSSFTCVLSVLVELVRLVSPRAVTFARLLPAVAGVLAVVVPVATMLAPPAAAGPSGLPQMPAATAGQDVGPDPAKVKTTGPKLPSWPETPRGPQAKAPTPPEPGSASAEPGSTFAQLGELPVSVAAPAVGQELLDSPLPADASAQQKAKAAAEDAAQAKTAQKLADAAPARSAAGGPAAGADKGRFTADRSADAAALAAQMGEKHPRFTSQRPQTSTDTSTDVATPAAQGAAPSAAAGSEAGSDASTGTPEVAAEGPAVSKVAVDTLDPATVTDFGGQSLGFQVRRADGQTSPGQVAVQVDVSSIDGAYGGGFAERLRLLRYPACVLTTPQVAECSQGTEVASRVDPSTHLLTAVVTADAGTATAVPTPSTSTATPSSTPTATSSAVSTSTSAATAPATALQTARQAATSSAGAPLPRDGQEASRSFSRVATSAVMAVPVLQAASGGAAVYAVSSSASGGSGDYSATLLKASDAWAVGEQSGSFTYSYPLPAVPSNGGETPSLALSYDSGSVDGLTSHENAQSSTVGLGWDMTVPYIEHKLKACTNADLVGNMCWGGEFPSISMNGQASRLQYMFSSSTGGKDVFRATSDQGWRIEQVFAGAGNGNGDNAGVYWKVTTLDGTEYYFGRQNTDWSTSANNSTLTQPVYAQSSADICWDKPNHTCTIAYRWNLSYVVDPSGNLQSYQWAKDRYSYATSSSAPAQSYDGAGYLTSITYGNRTANALSGPAPQRIDLAYGWRCDYSGCRAPQPRDSYAANYPDTPLDLWCDASASSCPNGPSTPAFFYLKKLESVTSTVYNGSGYSPVDKIALEVGWPKFKPEWAWSAVMWLRLITATGYTPSGTSQSLPDVSFEGDYDTWLPGRFDDTPVSGWHQEKPRITRVFNELGGSAKVTYGQPNDCAAQTLNGREDSQTTNCFPILESNGHQAWFRRYLVTRLDEVDKYGAPTQTTSYSYDTATGGAWHSDDNPVVPPADQRWSDWRGYAVVTVTEGTPGGVTSATEKRFFRGMRGDHNADGSNDYATVVTTKSGLNDPTSGLEYKDYNGRRGLPIEERVLRGDGSEDSATQHEYSEVMINGGSPGPWGLYQNPVTQIRESLTREMTTATGVVRNYKDLTRSTYDSTYGLPISVQDDGDPVSGAGPTCDYTLYSRNTTAWIVDTEAAQVSATGACPSNGDIPEWPYWTDRTETFYDANFTALFDPPTAGLATKVVKWASGAHTNDPATSMSASKYDASGRVIGLVSPDNAVLSATSFDTAGPATTTTFTATNGVLSGQNVTGPSGQTTSVAFDLGRRQPTTSTDQNGRVTTLGYDALGRLTTVRMPGDDFDAKTFTYSVSNTAPSVVTTSEYPAGGAAPIQSWQFYDSLGRVFQEQKATATGTVMTEGTRFDERGNDAVDVAAFAGTVTPGTVYGQWYDASFINALPSQTVSTFDATNAEVTSSLVAAGTTKWTSSTSYDGPTVTTTPPSNAGTGQADVAPTTTVSDFDGNVLTRTQGAKTLAYAYNATGDLTKITSPSGAVTTYGYDWLGRRTSSADPNAGTTTTDYYPSGNLKHSRDAKGNDLFTAQDVVGRPTATYAGTSASGALLSQTVYDGTPLGASSALLGTVTSETSYVGSTPGTPGTAYTLKYGYDARYHTTVTNQIIPAAVGSKLAGTYTTTVTYDGLGRQTSTRYPTAGGMTTEKAVITWSGAYPTKMASSLDGVTQYYVDSTTFTGIGQIASRVLGKSGTTGSVKRAYTWDPATGNLLTQAASTPSNNTAANLANDTYTYSTTGDVTKVTDAVAGQQQCYSYDTLDRLTAAATSASSSATGNGCTADTSGPAPYNDTYAYDGDANLTSLVHNGQSMTFGYGNNSGLSLTGGPNAPTTAVTSAGTTKYSYDAAGQLTSRVAGSTTTGYVWDSQDQLVSMTTGGNSTARFAYGPDDARWVRTTAAETVVYLAGQELHLATGAAAATAVRYYELEGHTVASRSNAAGGTSGKLSWILSDRQDSASVAVDATNGTATRDRYLPYGGNRASGSSTAWTMPSDRGWLGQIQDKELGLDFLNARYYDPVLAHFISTDPFNVQDDPQSANPYGYAAGNPISFTDPDGLWPRPAAMFKSAASWVSSHKAEITEVAVGVAVGVALTAFVVGTGGVGGLIIAGAVAGAAGASAGYGVRVAEKKETFSGKGLLKAAGTGAAAGAAGGALGYVGGKVASVGVKALAQTGVGKAAGQAASTAARAVKARASGAVAKAANRVTSGSKGVASACVRHSFAPTTLVLMADGTAKAIGEIQQGEQVTATDPATGQTSAEPVTSLHHNIDTDLVDVTIQDENSKSESTVHTTAHHPFYDLTTQSWVDAVDLLPGHLLRTHQAGAARITGLTSIKGQAIRRDLTVASIHTYHVLFGDSAVLVHNCDTPKITRAAEAHITTRHMNREKLNYPTKSVFDSKNKAKVMRMVKQTMRQGTVRVEGEGRNKTTYYTRDFGRTIGRSKHYGEQRHVTVKVKNGKVKTAYPSDRTGRGR